MTFIIQKADSYEAEQYALRAEAALAAIDEAIIASWPSGLKWDSVHNRLGVNFTTSDPDYTLDVAGNGQFLSTVAVQSVISVGTEHSIVDLVNKRASGGLLNGDELGAYKWSAWDASQYKSHCTYIQSLATENWTLTQHGTDMRFSTTLTGAEEATLRAYFDGSGIFQVNNGIRSGKLSTINSNIVGINILSPTVGLMQIDGYNYVASCLTFSATNQTTAKFSLGMVASTGGAGFCVYDNAASAYRAVISDSGCFAVGGYTNEALLASYKFACQGTSYFSSTVNLAGKLNIGIAGTGSGGSIGLVWNYGSNAAARAWRAITDMSSAGDWQLQQEATRAGGDYATKLYISPSGLVEIGGSAPTAQFSVLEKGAMNEIGGYMVKLTNKTGATSVKGTVVYASSTTDSAFNVNPIDGNMPFGVVFTSGVADGSECWVTVSGVAEVLLVNTVATTRGYVAISSAAVAGRIDTSATAPSSTEHFREIGHTLESKTGGTNVLCKCVLHFN